MPKTWQQQRDAEIDILPVFQAQASQLEFFGSSIRPITNQERRDLVLHSTHTEPNEERRDEHDIPPGLQRVFHDF